MVTEYEYGDDGRLLRSVATSESRWTDMDRAEAFALGMHRDGICPLCGQSLAVCTADEKAGAPEITADYTACRSTLARLERLRALTDNGKKDDPYAPAYLWAFKTRGGNG